MKNKVIRIASVARTCMHIAHTSSIHGYNLQRMCTSEIAFVHFSAQAQVDKTRWFLVPPNGLVNMKSEHKRILWFQRANIEHTECWVKILQKNKSSCEWEKSHKQWKIDSMNFWMQYLEFVLLSLIFWKWHHACSERWMIDSYWLLLRCIALNPHASVQCFSFGKSFSPRYAIDILWNGSKR